MLSSYAVGEGRSRDGHRRADVVSGQNKGKPVVHKEDGALPGGGVKLNSAFSLNKVHSVFTSFVGEKKDLVQEFGFGGLMAVHRQPKFSRILAFWLVSNMDSATNSSP